MKLYLIEADTTGYDVFVSAVVAAPDEEAARRTHPGGSSWRPGAWVPWTEVRATYIGEAEPGRQPSVICASFNAG